MARIVGSIPRWFAFGVALAATGWVDCVPAQFSQGSARVMSIRGSAEFQVPGGLAWRKLKVNQVLFVGTTVRTSVNSQVDLWLKQNGPVVRVTANTTLALDRLDFEEHPGGEVVVNTQLNLVEGTILANVKKLAAASRYDVKTPTGTVDMRSSGGAVSTRPRGRRLL